MRTPKLREWIFFFILPAANLMAAWAGNPAQPAIQTAGIIHTSPNWWSFRVSYVGDFVYRQRFRDEFHIAGANEVSHYIKLWTQAGMLTLNFRDRIDLYGILGGSRLHIDQDIAMSQQLCWGVGGKLIVLHEGNFRLGLDVKFFQSNQSPEFLLFEHQAYNVMSDFHFDYYEIQAAMGVAYRTKYVSPYASASYLLSKIEPRPLTFLVRPPSINELADVSSTSVLGNRRWGLVLGATLIDEKKATLAMEWRAFNQNSVNVTGEIRF